ncbi:hypothetical protein F7731_02885 [Cytobacillus depressus]|uniref:DUF2802 domain-containing protein n=1 Tax=Cytobacillus depressus TaxID=1602942 RepID=A0A6L3VCY0_9BACI|nr:hypothetical protein [Cytobacillus depressus]KAB2338523.1 hypothetical protein F7731_02885 [Cytobacillus depressus]
MEYIMIGLLAFSLILLIISVFMKDPYKSIREELDQLSIQHIQDLYIVKKKLKVLEEELLVNDADFPFQSSTQTPTVKNQKKEIHEIIKNQVCSLVQQGLTVEQIARQSSLSPSEVEWIISEKMGRR